MTLRKQIFISITLILVILLTGSLLVILKNEQIRLRDQLALHAQETATSLAFSISNAASNDQRALIESMISVIFDSGYYQNITYINTKGQVVIDHDRPVKVEGIPEWFMQWKLIPPAKGSAVVMSGWRQLGEIVVVINPGLAAREFWFVIREQSLLFIGIAFLACALAAIALRILLKPLYAVEKQAELVCEKQFVEQEILPGTRELRQVVIAMNRMARKLKEIFSEQLELIESLRVQSYIDPVTKLSNRSHFNALLQTVIDRQEKCDGIMILMQIGKFTEFNLHRGREAGDMCLQTLAHKLQEIFSECPDAIIGRRGGVDFAVYLPGFSLERTKTLATTYLAWASDLDLLMMDDSALPLHMGISFTKHIKSTNPLFNEADLALTQAQKLGDNCWQVYHDENTVEVARQANQWFKILQKTIEQRSIVLHYQPMFDNNKNVISHEVLCRINDGSVLVNAGIFFPMIDRFGMSVEFDKLIIEKTVELIYSQINTEKSSPPVSPSFDTVLTVNISTKTLASKDFEEWIEQFLYKNKSIAKYLVMETAGHLTALDENTVRNIISIVKKYGAGFSFDHFGVHSLAFTYLQSMPLKYLKIDRTFIKQINENQDNQFYVKVLLQTAHSRDILVYAEGVETEEEWQCVVSLGFDGGQGYYLGKPSDKLMDK